MKETAGRIIGHYERHARDWDADRNHAVEPWNDKPWHDRFADALPSGAAVLDLGCGSGSPVAAFLAEHGFRVTGVDSSPTLISLFRERLPDHEWVMEDMRRLDLPRAFDGILAWDSFFHLTPDDQRRMFDVFARHAAPAAVLMFNSGPAHGESVGSYRGDPLYHASLSADENIALLGGIGFKVVAHAVEDWQTGGGRTVWLTRARVVRTYMTQTTSVQSKSSGHARRNFRASDQRSTLGRFMAAIMAQRLLPCGNVETLFPPH